MTVWNEIKRAYEIQKELTSIPLIQTVKGSKQRRWLLEREKFNLLLSIEQEKGMSNWWEKILIDIALWGLDEPFIVNRIFKK